VAEVVRVVATIPILKQVVVELVDIDHLLLEKAQVAVQPQKIFLEFLCQPII